MNRSATTGEWDVNESVHIILPTSAGPLLAWAGRLPAAAAEGEGHGGYGILDPAELARAKAFTSEESRVEFVAGRVVQRRVVAELAGRKAAELRCAYTCNQCGADGDGAHGQPGYLFRGEPVPLRLSFSRCADWFLLVISQGSHGSGLGADLESVGNTTFDAFDDVALTSAERQHVASLPLAQRPRWRAETWARKEALVKATGAGLRRDPATIEAYPHQEPAVLENIAPHRLGLPADFAVGVAAVVNVAVHEPVRGAAGRARH